MNEGQGKLWNAFLGRVVLPFATGVLGFGSSQLIAVQSMRERLSDNSHQIAALSQGLTRESHDREESDHINQENLRSLTLLVNKVIEQNAEVIGLFKMQQQFQSK